MKIALQLTILLSLTPVVSTVVLDSGLEQYNNDQDDSIKAFYNRFLKNDNKELEEFMKALPPNALRGYHPFLVEQTSNEKEEEKSDSKDHSSSTMADKKHHHYHHSDNGDYNTMTYGHRHKIHSGYAGGGNHDSNKDDHSSSAETEQYFHSSKDEMEKESYDSSKLKQMRMRMPGHQMSNNQGTMAREHGHNGHEMSLQKHLDHTNEHGLNSMTSEEYNVVMDLFDNIDSIERTIEHVYDPDHQHMIGIMTNTTSGDHDVASLIQKHVLQMKEMLKDGREIKMNDPLFFELFHHRNEISMDIKPINSDDDAFGGGVSVITTGTTKCSKSIIQEHATVHSFMIEHGMSEVCKKHDAPVVCTTISEET